MKNAILIFIVVIVTACSKKNTDEKPVFSDGPVPESALSERQLYDKILGMLVGSAIGDAMGAPTEMWSRESIQLEYGFVESLDSMIREVSPEGIWVANLPAGGTTDDTRWKLLATEFLLTQERGNLDAADFAELILEKYQSYVKEFKAIETTAPEPFEKVNLKMGWLQEWAKVSQPFINNNLVGYSDSLGKFYGGEMVCAGLLYSPALGAYFPGNPEKAYQETYKLSIYDWAMPKISQPYQLP